jgi:large subunit ribosomal protein L23
MALHLTQVLIKPLITEKNNLGREARNEVVFEVHPQANKKVIQLAVEQLFAVEVAEVRTISKKGKIRRVGRFSGFRADTKKAVVKLKQGHDVDFFQTT